MDQLSSLSTSLLPVVMIARGGAGGHIDMYGLDVEMLWSTSLSFGGSGW